MLDYCKYFHGDVNKFCSFLFINIAIKCVISLYFKKGFKTFELNASILF